MRIIQMLFLLAAGLVFAGCRAPAEDMEYVEEPAVPVVCIEGKAEAFYIANGPRFDNLEALIRYLKLNHDRITLREMDSPVPFAEKLVGIFSANGITVKDYLYLYPPPDPSREKKESGETLTF